MYMADIVYTFENKIYMNITNACPCRCKFCIRNNGDSVGEAKTLWFSAHTPSFAEIRAAIDAWDFSKYQEEVVFCGYGEPTCAYETLLQTAAYLKGKGLKLRLNTNGLSDLVNKKPTAKTLCALFDTISISLNAPTAEKYNDLCQPTFGEAAFDAILQFARDCKETGVNLKFTLVDVITKADIDACQTLADAMEIPLRVRAYTAD